MGYCKHIYRKVTVNASVERLYRMGYCKRVYRKVISYGLL